MIGERIESRSIPLQCIAAAIFSGLVKFQLGTPWAILWRYWRIFTLVRFCLVGLILEKGGAVGGLLVLILTGIIHIATIWLQLFIGRWKYLKFASATLVSLLLRSFSCSVLEGF